MFVRDVARRRAFVLLAACVLLGACGGGGSKSGSGSAPTAVGKSGATASATTASDGATGSQGNCFTTPGTQKARVRFVNLFTNETYPSSDIDVYQGYGADDPCSKKLATVKYGAASDYIDVTAGDSSGDWTTVAYVAGSADKDHQIMNQSETWKGGEVVTIVFQGGDPSNTGSGLPPSAGGDQTFYETGTPDAPPAVSAIAGKAVIGAGANSLQYLVKNDGWYAGLAGGSGCLMATDDTATVKGEIGGTDLRQYPTAPGSITLGFYNADPGTCSGTPDIGPVTFDAAPGSRTYVFAYGSDPSNLNLLALPLAPS